MGGVPIQLRELLCVFELSAFMEDGLFARPLEWEDSLESLCDQEC